MRGLDQGGARKTARPRKSRRVRDASVAGGAVATMPWSTACRPRSCNSRRIPSWPGRAIFETTRGNLDASVETQLHEIEQGLTDRLDARHEHTHLSISRRTSSNWNRSTDAAHGRGGGIDGTGSGLARSRRRDRRFLRNPHFSRPHHPHRRWSGSATAACSRCRSKKPAALQLGDTVVARRRQRAGRGRDRTAGPRARRFRPADGRRTRRSQSESFYDLYRHPAARSIASTSPSRWSRAFASIDSMLPCGKGQRIGIFGGSGVGKSTLLGRHVAPQLRRRNGDRADRRAQPRSARVSSNTNLAPEG